MTFNNTDTDVCVSVIKYIFELLLNIVNYHLLAALPASLLVMAVKVGVRIFTINLVVYRARTHARTHTHISSLDLGEGHGPHFVAITDIQTRGLGKNENYYKFVIYNKLLQILFFTNCRIQDFIGNIIIKE